MLKQRNRLQSTHPGADQPPKYPNPLIIAVLHPGLLSDFLYARGLYSMCRPSECFCKVMQNLAITSLGSFRGRDFDHTGSKDILAVSIVRLAARSF
jgi:hypothetical protein